MRNLLLAALLMSAHAAAQPRVTAVVNGASFQGAVAPGSFASLFGENLAAVSETSSTTEWPTQLGGVTVEVNGGAAPIQSVRADQINFQVPRDASEGSASVVVRSNAGSSAAFNFTITAAAPGILTFRNSQAVAQHADGSLITRDSPAAAGEAVIIYLTGQGAVDNPVADGSPSPSSPLANVTQAASVTVGGRNAPIQFLGLTPGFIGLAQANITIPEIAGGDHAVVITIAGTASQSNAAVLSVGREGPRRLARLGAVETGSTNINVAVRDSRAYVCGASISVVDVSVPSSPRLITVTNQAGGRCHLLPDHLVVARSTNPGTVSVMSLERPDSPALIGGPATTPQPFISDFFLARNHGFFSTASFEFNIGNPNRIFRQHGELFSMSFENPSSPANAGTLRRETNRPATSNESPFFNLFAPDNQTLLLMSTNATGSNTGGGQGRVVVVDISRPASLVALRQLIVPRTAILNCAASGGLNGIAFGNTSSWQNPGDFRIHGNLTLTTLDFTNPRDPSVIATNVTSARNGFATPGCVSLGGGHYAIAVNNTPESPLDTSLLVIDARNPRLPTIASTINVTGLSGGLAVSGDKLYVTATNGLVIYQIEVGR